jgi:ABC-type sugar transport system ATPase subunit
MTVTANAFLNREITNKFGMLNMVKMNSECKKILEVLGYDIDVNKRISALTIVEKTIVEIAKAMLLNPRLLILDEVTAPLNRHEVDHLFKIIKELRSKGLAIIFIGHRIQEIMQISDRIAILRDGQLVSEIEQGDSRMTEREIIRDMLGEGNEFNKTKAVSGKYDTDHSRDAENLLELRSLTLSGFFRDINLTLKKGEIVGLAGLKGSGITELLKTVYGRAKLETGEIVVKGKKVIIGNPSVAIKSAGIGFITNDRQNEGLALIRNVSENISVASLDLLRNSLRILRKKAIADKAKDFVSKLNIRTPGIQQEVQFLSGGNQQKIVIAKWLLRDLDILLIDEPTRGVDIKAKNEIYRLLIDQKKRDKGIIVSSPEIHELLNLCDRILIVVSGKILCEIKSGDEGFNEAHILELIHIESA